MDKSTWVILILGLALLLSVLYLITLMGPFLSTVSNTPWGIASTFLVLLAIVIVLAVAFSVAIRVKLAYY